MGRTDIARPHQVKQPFVAIALVVLGTISSIGAQPVLTSDNTLGQIVGLSVTFTTLTSGVDDGVQALAAISGEDQVWDVTGLAFMEASSQTYYFTEPRAGMPIAEDPRLETANVVSVGDSLSPGWVYRRLEESGEYMMARVALRDVDRDGRLDTLITVYDPASVTFPFPMTFETAWEDSSAQTLEFRHSPPVPVETIISSHAVDGWGTLITPHGEAPALRIRTDARVTAAGGQKSTRHMIRLITPFPSVFTERATYPSHVEIQVDSLGAPIEFTYMTMSGYTPVALEPLPHIALGPAMRPNFPNPFRSVTTIPFSIDRPQRVRVAIFDIVGRRVEDLLDIPLPAGEHAVQWDAMGLSSGVYRVVVESGRTSSSRLVVLRR